MAFKKENLLYFALAIPVLMIAVTMLSVFFFGVDLHPQYNFIYAQINTPSDYVCEMQLEAKLHPDSFPKNIKVPYNSPDHDCSKAELYLYDFSAKSSTKLTIEQAQIPIDLRSAAFDHGH